MILLVPFEFPDAAEMELLRQRLEKGFGERVKVSERLLNPLDYYDPERKQYYSSAILDSLSRAKPRNSGKILAVTNLDLYIPILTFVFGEAQLSGSCAVVSSIRLDTTFYGLPPDKNLLGERLYKEAVHELGHTYGLIHCRDTQCVMRTSTYVEEIDLKSGDFCQKCAVFINQDRNG